MREEWIYLGLLKVVSERGGEHIVMNFQPLLDSSIEATVDTLGADEEDIRKEEPRSRLVQQTWSTKKFHPMGSKAILKRFVEEEEDEEETPIVRSGRVLPKSCLWRLKQQTRRRQSPMRLLGRASVLRGDVRSVKQGLGPRKRAIKAKSSVQEGEDKVESFTEELDKEIDEILAQALLQPFISNSLITLDAFVLEQKEENPSDRAIGSDVVVGTRDEEEKDGLEIGHDEDEDLGQRDGKGIVMAEEEAEVEEEEEDESDESERPLTKKYHLWVLSRRRSTIPHRKMVTRYANIRWAPLAVEQEDT
ncbi:hypothetical protein Dimus_006152 [Dionaea muscipula]